MEATFDETWFYAPLQAIGDRAILPESESSHLQKVLRIRPGRRIVVTNGQGSVFECDTRSSSGELEIESVAILSENPIPPSLHLLLALLKGRDLEDPVEGLCQLPIASIQLVTTDFTQEFKGQDHSKLVERLRMKSLVGLKQAKKPWLTEIYEPVSLRGWRSSHANEPMIIAHPGPDLLPADSLETLHLLIGPEGGFSQSELDWLIESEKLYRLGLGITRIRAAHAPMLACGKLMGLGLA